MRLYNQRKGLTFRILEVIYIAKTKALIRCTVSAQLIQAFVFAYAKNRFIHDIAQ